VESVVRIGAQGIQIAKGTEARAAAAVVMATHGRTGLVRSPLGSITSTRSSTSISRWGWSTPGNASRGHGGPVHEPSLAPAGA
jgi:hypothetical protein